MNMENKYNSIFVTTAKGANALLIIMILLFCQFTFSQACYGSLSVKNDKNVGTADEDGAQFELIVTNETGKSTEYKLSTNFLDTPCATTHRSNLGDNVQLKVSFKDKNHSSQENIKLILSPNESRKILIDVQTLKGQEYNRWSCIQIELDSEDCSNQIAKQLLRVFVPNPNDE